MPALCIASMKCGPILQSGVSQIRHTHSIGDAIDLVKPGHHAAPPSDPIVPSYTIDMEQQALPPQVSSSALPAAPPQGECSWTWSLALTRKVIKHRACNDAMMWVAI